MPPLRGWISPSGSPLTQAIPLRQDRSVRINRSVRNDPSGVDLAPYHHCISRRLVSLRGVEEERSDGDESRRARATVPAGGATTASHAAAAGVRIAGGAMGPHESA